MFLISENLSQYTSVSLEELMNLLMACFFVLVISYLEKMIVFKYSSFKMPDVLKMMFEEKKCQQGTCMRMRMYFCLYDYK